MRKTFMSIQKVMPTYPEAMTFDANAKLGDSGSCRRR